MNATNAKERQSSDLMMLLSMLALSSTKTPETSSG